MAFKGQQVPVTAAATPLNGTDADQIFGQSLTFWCPVALAVGGSDVTWGTGAQLPANTYFPVDFDPGEVVYVATQSGASTVHVVHQGA